MTDRAVLAQKLKDAREAAGLTQEEAAKRLDVHAMTISRWERGEQGLRASALSKAARVYGVMISELLDNSVDAIIDTVARETRPIDTGARYTLTYTDYAHRLDQATHIPERAREVAAGYLARLARAGIPHEEIARFEEQLTDDRLAMQFSRRHGTEWDADDWILSMESTWRNATDWLIPRGVVP